MRGEGIAKYLSIKDKAVGLIPGMRWALTSTTPTTGDTLWYDGSEWMARAATQSATIASGAITLSGSWVRLLIADTEGGAASDDLTDIAGGTAGQVLVVKAADSARTVVIRSTGNIDLSTGDGDQSQDNAFDTMTLVYDGSEWLETSRSNNAA